MTTKKSKPAKKAPALSTVSRNRLLDFDEAAQSWGLLSDRGIGPSVTKAEKEYGQTRAALEERILHLERRLKKASAELAQYRPKKATVRV